MFLRHGQCAEGVIYEMTADHSNRILVLLLQSIWVSEKMEEVRGNIYAVLVQFERCVLFSVQVSLLLSVA